MIWLKKRLEMAPRCCRHFGACLFKKAGKTLRSIAKINDLKEEEIKIIKELPRIKRVERKEEALQKISKRS